MTLVLDASVLAEFLVGSPAGRRATPRILADRDLHIPHLAVVEVASVVRGWVLGGHLPEPRARGALDDLAALPAARWSAEPLLPRLWALRSNMTADDATYVALAEGVEATLLTADARLVRAAEQFGECSVELVDAGTGR
ncbi:MULTISPECIES: type II toxin-antitoxin system VapC family toxin [unclassified Isoptericola]|uniref:type II toxin-antitoxin system VapC family toxin n=1 Tax=unclassified Isoptericola TaxID=2623355 RepID=UPI00271375DC|nr:MULTISPECIES: type II toxin-antitoxin system VapC family toxin [unclassified Isoptericola]MDO8148810.1 type II toxin-antitoxin system VapC family toxin [Isoptericola sp. b515]MDO8151249.1 type II toxin-antitoxin system VapC family toxin [Isoptericola sp. b408]